jgi:hypothetical protein
MFGNVWHSMKLREFQPKIAARPEKAAHYTQRFAVLQQSGKGAGNVRKTSAASATECGDDRSVSGLSPNR